MNKKTAEEVLAAQGRLVFTDADDGMYPLILPGDLPVIKTKDGLPRKFDIVLYRRGDGEYALRRIVSINDDTYVMRGDNRGEMDYGVTEEQITGMVTGIIRDGKTVPIDRAERLMAERTTRDLLYLLSCAVNEVPPSAKRCKEMDLMAVYRLARSHFLTAAAAFALEQAVELPREFDQAKKKAIRKLAFFEIERAGILREFEKEGIWYLPLKGILLGSCYPKSAMREMNDNDILCDSEKMTEVKAIMTRLGYTCKMENIYIHDSYEKPPTLEFEMHRMLFDKEEYPQAYNYYKDIAERLSAKDGSGYCRRMTDEDLYVYLICHMYKHFVHAGTGLRSLLDIYVYNKTRGNGLRRDYIKRELKKLGLTRFEKETRSLAKKAFGGRTLSSANMKKLRVYSEAGVCGTRTRAENSRILRMIGGDSPRAKSNYFIKRLFISDETLKNYYPTVYRHKVLYPFLLLYRFAKSVVTHPKAIFYEIKTVCRFRNN